jgi:hypothetical protein
MAMKFVKQQKEFPQKTYGIGTVKAGKNKVRVIIHDGKSGEEVFNGMFGFDDLPKIPKIEPESGEHEFNIVLSGDKDCIEKLGPVEGHFLARFVDFARPDPDEMPTPVTKEKTNNKGEKYFVDEFYPEFEIIKGKFKGVRIRHWLHHLFQQDPDDLEMAAWKGDLSNPNAKWLPRLVDFCSKVGADFENNPPAWPENGNLLPEILSRGLQANKIVDLTIKKGFISDILSADYEEEEEEKPKSKKSPAKALKKQEVDEDDDL